MATHTPSQKYLSTRGGSYDFSFEEVVLKGLASDGGLFIPEEIPSASEQLPADWPELSFVDLAFHIFSLYISPSEIPSADLHDIVKRSYSTFRSPDIAPVVTLDQSANLYLLELFHGPTFAFKDVALQFVGNLFEYFLVRRNQKNAKHEHLTVVGATSGDTGSAAIYGLRGKKDVSVFIMYPDGKISPVQEAQMTTVLDKNVHNLAVEGTFDDCQALLKSLFADTDINQSHKIGAVNSINWARILAQITYYFYTYSLLFRSAKIKAGDKIRFIVPTGNFGDVLAGYFAKRMGLPVEKLVVATNENDILHRFWQTGYYEKKAAHGHEGNGALVGSKDQEEAVKETLSPAMDILVSSNFERLLWFLAFEVYGQGSVADRRKAAGEKVKGWLQDLTKEGGFGVEASVISAAKRDFESERVSDNDTIQQITDTFSFKGFTAANPVSRGTGGTESHGGYILDPHTAIGVAASYRTREPTHRPEVVPRVSLATAHPAKFSKAVQMALENEPTFRFEDLLPDEFRGLEKLPRRKTQISRSEGLEGLKSAIRAKVPSSSRSA